MTAPLPFLEPDAWIANVFAAKSVNQGGIIRRSLRDIDRIVGQEMFLSEVRRRGFQAVRNGDQLVIFCNAEPIRRVV